MADTPQLITKLAVDLSQLDAQLKAGGDKMQAYAKKNETVQKDTLSRIERMYAKVKLTNDLAVANVAGNREQIQNLQDQLELNRQIVLARRSGMNVENSTKAAEQHMAAVRAARTEAEAASAAVAAANRSAALEQIGLEERLAVARARGEKREIEALEEELVLARAVAKYRSAGFGEQEAKSMAHAHVTTLGQAHQRSKLGNAGEAVEGIFDRSRLAVLEEGGAKIPIFGSALEALGPAGLVAAAGVAAAAGAMEQAKSAAEYAEEIQITADKLGITTKALQQYNFVAVSSGVSTDDMKEALQRGNEALGAFQANIGANKLKPVFAALGITPDEARKAGSIADLFPEIADKIRGLGSAAEQAKVAEKLGLSSILPVLQKGKEGFEEFMAESVRAGAVLDTGLIAKGKEAAEELKKSSDIVELNMKRAFIALAPVIEKCVTLIASMARGVADTIEDLGSIMNMSTTAATDVKADAENKMAMQAKVGRALGGHIDPTTGLMSGGATGLTGVNLLYNKNKQVADQAEARINYNTLADKAAAAATHQGAPKQLVADKEKKAKTSDQADLSKTVADTLDTANKSLDTAMAALTSNIEAHAAFEKKAVDDELAKQQEDLRAETDKINADKTISGAKKRQLTAELAQAGVADQAAAVAKKDLIDRNAALALAARDLAQREAIDRYYDQIVQISAGMARSSSERLGLELKLLAYQKAEADRAARVSHDKQLAENPQDATRINSEFAQTQGAANKLYAAQIAQTTHANMSPWDTWKNSGVQSAGEVSDALQTEAVKSLGSFNDGLTDAIVNGKNLGQTMEGIFRSMEADLLRYLLKQAEIGMLGGPVALGGAGATLPTGSAIVGDISASGANPANGWYGLGASSGTLDTALTNTGMDPTGAGDLGTVGKGISDLGGVLKLFGIPGFQHGTDDAPGGETLVGENGPELLNLPGGAKVQTNTELNDLTRTGKTSLASPPVAMSHTVKIDLTGANGEEAINRAAMAAAHQGTMLAIASSRADLKKAQRAPQRSLLSY